MQQLNLPTYQFRFGKSNKGDTIFDEVRKKFVVLTPEEWVRQNFIKYLISEKQFPLSLMRIESGVSVHSTQKRTDIQVCDTTGKVRVIVECKSVDIPVNQEVFDQAARYNITLKADYLIVTNGLKHYCCNINHAQGTYHFIQEIPLFTLL